MTATEHNRLLGIFYTVLGGLIVLGGLAFIAMPFLVNNGHHASDDANYWSGVKFVVGLGTFVLIVGLAALTVGVGVLQQRSWARVASIVTGIIFLVNFPLGMALGIYTLIFMFSDKGQQLYSNPHPPQNW